jgi:hypothetical protein
MSMKELENTKLGDLVKEADSEFFTRHPEWAGKKLTQAPEQAPLRSEWNRIFSDISLKKVKKIALASSK